MSVIFSAPPCPSSGPASDLPLDEWARLFVIDQRNQERHRRIVAELLAELEASR